MITEETIRENDYQKYLSAFKEWHNHEYWTVKEFANMLLGFRPESGKGIMGFFCKSLEDSDAVNKLQEMIKKCADVSLRTKGVSKNQDETLLLQKSCLEWNNDKIEAHDFWRRAQQEINGHSV